MRKSLSEVSTCGNWVTFFASVSLLLLVKEKFSLSLASTTLVALALVMAAIGSRNMGRVAQAAILLLSGGLALLLLVKDGGSPWTTLLLLVVVMIVGFIRYAKRIKFADNLPREKIPALLRKRQELLSVVWHTTMPEFAKEASKLEKRLEYLLKHDASEYEAVMVDVAVFFILYEKACRSIHNTNRPKN